MNFTIILPSTSLTLEEWMAKHKVSSNICSIGLATCRATDSVDN